MGTSHRGRHLAPQGSGGFSLVEALIGVALIGVVVLAVLALYDFLQGASIKAAMAHEADALSAKTQQVLSSRTWCDGALAGNAWDGVNESQIVIRDVSGGILAQESQLLADGKLRIDRVTLRPFRVDINADQTAESIPTTAPTILANVTKGYFVGEISISISPTALIGRFGQAMTRRSVVAVIVDPGTGLIERCDLNNEATTARPDLDCTLPRAIADGNPCGPIPAPNAANECEERTYVGSINAEGEPKCHCFWACMTPMWHPAGAPSRCVGNPTIGPGNTACPAALFSLTPPPVPCFGQLNGECEARILDSAGCPIKQPYRLQRWRCRDH